MRRWRSRGDRAARRAWPTGCCAGCATSRRFAPTAGSPARSPTTRCSCSKSTSAASTRSIGRLLRTIIDKFGGGPVGVGTLAAAMSEEKDAIEEIYEPFLIQIGFLDRTPRGRVATARAYEYLGLNAPAKDRLW